MSDEALKVAIRAKDFDGAMAALKAGAKIDDDTSNELLTKFGADSFLFKTPEVGAERIRVMFANGVNPAMGGPALIVATRMGTTIPMASALLAGGVDVNFQNRAGYTALHNAVRADAVELVRVLLAAGARSDLKDETKKTVMQIAKGEILELLKAAGGAPAKPEPKAKKKPARAAVPEALAAFLKGKAKDFASPEVEGLPTFGRNAAGVKFLKASNWDSFAEDLDLDPKEYPTLHPFAKLDGRSEFLVVDSATDALAVQMWDHEDEKFHAAFDSLEKFTKAIREAS
jgi:hypothetical protein